MSLDKWFKEDWVDIGSPKKGGGYEKCGRKSANGSSRAYPKCVPAAKAASMTESQRRSAVIRKRAAGNVGPKPTNVKTIKASEGKMLKGKQKNIDVNKDGKITGEDFSMLKKSKKVILLVVVLELLFRGNQVVWQKKEDSNMSKVVLKKETIKTM